MSPVSWGGRSPASCDIAIHCERVTRASSAAAPLARDCASSSAAPRDHSLGQCAAAAPITSVADGGGAAWSVGASNREASRQLESLYAARKIDQSCATRPAERLGHPPPARSRCTW
eukprot:scaffold43920_cov69-Phaeocystis_antarctica.AAC.7